MVLRGASNRLRRSVRSQVLRRFIASWNGKKVQTPQVFFVTNLSFSTFLQCRVIKETLLLNVGKWRRRKRTKITQQKFSHFVLLLLKSKEIFYFYWKSSEAKNRNVIKQQQKNFHIPRCWCWERKGKALIPSSQGGMRSKVFHDFSSTDTHEKPRENIPERSRKIVHVACVKVVVLDSLLLSWRHTNVDCFERHYSKYQTPKRRANQLFLSSLQRAIIWITFNCRSSRHWAIVRSDPKNCDSVCRKDSIKTVVCEGEESVLPLTINRD